MTNLLGSLASQAAAALSPSTPAAAPTSTPQLGASAIISAMYPIMQQVQIPAGGASIINTSLQVVVLAPVYPDQGFYELNPGGSIPWPPGQTCFAAVYNGTGNGNVFVQPGVVAYAPGNVNTPTPSNPQQSVSFGTIDPESPQSFECAGPLTFISWTITAYTPGSESSAILSLYSQPNETGPNIVDVLAQIGTTTTNSGLAIQSYTLETDLDGPTFTGYVTLQGPAQNFPPT